MNNITYIWSDAVVDNIARKVAEEPMEDIDDRPQHIIDEERGDMIINKRFKRFYTLINSWKSI